MEYKAFELKLTSALAAVFGVAVVLSEFLGYLSSNDTEFALHLVALCFGVIVVILWLAGKYA
ncbi:hypothetical protein [Halorussus salinus]|uniref:hypothetical protein n=1 Tax=Halorussus salinus TaxID=1364935 RepID=UPI0010932735|nr:hypothetical protein [Halorussus salinus]